MFHNIARMTTGTTGTGTITLGSAVSGYNSFANAGVINGETVTYGISDGANSEVGRGVYTASGTTLTRATILDSTNGGAAISLSGSAQVFLTVSGQDLNTQTPPIRQTVLSGVNSAGTPSALSAGSGLAVNLAATASPFTVSFAAGFGANGAVDYVGRATVDTASFWSSLPASSLSFLSVTYNSGGLTAGSTLAPPQYGYTYKQSSQSSLTINNTIIDDFGNSWTNTGVTFSNTSPKYTGTYYGVFNGSSYISTTAITSFGNGSWTIRSAINPSALPSSGGAADIITAYNTANTNLAVFLRIYNNAGSIKFAYSLSSTGTTFDIASNVQGTTTPSTGTWYDVELTFDSLVGVYRLYVNGTQEASTTSSTIVAPILVFGVGAGKLPGAPSNFFNGSISGVEFLPYCKHTSGTSFTPQTALANITTAGYASDWFDILSFQMKSVSAASTTAGTNPTFTANNKVYVGEAVTGSSTVSSVITYAYNGIYHSGWFAVGASSAYVKNDYLGIPPEQKIIDISGSVLGLPGAGYPQQGGVKGGTYGWVPTEGNVSNRNSFGLTTLASPINGTTGAASGYYYIFVERAW